MARTVSFILVAYRNDPRAINELVASLREGTVSAGYGFETCVVANDKESAVDLDPNCKLIVTQSNVGFAAGVELGVQATSGEFIVVANPDCAVTATEVEDFLSHLDDATIIVPHLVNESGASDHFAYENWTYSLGRKLSERRCKRALRSVPTRGMELPSFAKAPGAFIAVARSTLRRVGHMFDPTFFLYAEDRDLTSRARDAKIPVVCVPTRITHIGGVSGRDVSDLVKYCQTDGSLRIAHRRYGRLGAWAYAIDALLVAALRHRGSLGSVRRAVSRWSKTGFVDPGRITEADMRSLNREM